jgi:hypothetical protein
VAHLIVVGDLAGPGTSGRGGHCMYLFQWLHGLERLGHRVFFIEFLHDDEEEPGEFAARYFADTVAQWWHPEQAVLARARSARSLYGPSLKEVSRIAAEADAVIELAAHYCGGLPPVLENIRPRVLVEQDPGYTHLWAVERDPAWIYGEYDLYYTVGGNIGSPRCAVPTHGRDWRPIWNPVILDWWPPAGDPVRDRFTTVADWRSYGYLEFGNQMLGPKAEEFVKFIRLPGLSGETLEIALVIDPEDPDLADLRTHGWRVEDPLIVADPARYHRYVSGSAGEFSCAKGGYAGTRCGWFSDRSACYLAAGRPVVLQATGFEDRLPTGKGLFAFTTIDEAAEALLTVRRDYALHSAAARAIARDYLDSDRVLGGLLAEIGVGGAALCRA